MSVSAILSSLLLLASADKVPERPLPSSVDGLPIGAIPKQQLPATGCAVYLWTAGVSRAMIAAASTDPAQLRVSLGGAITDLPRTAQVGGGQLGFAETTEYAAAGVTAVLDMDISMRADLTKGAAVPTATLRIDRAGQDSIVIPAAGLIGCA